MPVSTGFNIDGKLKIQASISGRDMQRVLSKLRQLPKHLQGPMRRKILRKAAKPLVQRARQLAPRAEEIVKRYSTPKVSGKLKAPKGLGQVESQYFPGNLSRSIQVLPLRNTFNVVVGPKRAKRNTGGDFAGTHVDGWYGHFLEFGTKHIAASPYMRPAFDTTLEQVKQIIRDQVGKVLRDFERKTGLRRA